MTLASAPRVWGRGRIRLVYLLLAVHLLSPPCVNALSSVVEIDASLSVGVPELPPCYETLADLGKNLEGSWHDEPYEFSGAYARTTDHDEWYRTACPAENRVFSCSRHPADVERAHRIENRRYNPTHCQLSEYNPMAFLELIRNRRILACCDSLSMQFFVALVCSLHGATPSTYNLFWNDRRWIFGTDDCLPTGEHCHMDYGVVHYPAYNASIALIETMLVSIQGKGHGDNTMTEYRNYGHLGRGDILVLNFGVHMGSSRDYEQQLRRLAEEYTRGASRDNALEEARSNMPFLMWRETAPQHFGPTGWYGGDYATSECTFTVDRQQAYLDNFRVQVSNRVMEEYGVPIIKIYNATQTEWWTHIGLQNRTDESDRQDCTHFCSPSGVIFHWRQMFYNVLLAATKDGVLPEPQRLPRGE